MVPPWNAGSETTGLAPWNPGSETIARREARSQSFMVWSLLPEARSFPSGENASDWTSDLCPRSAPTCRRVVTSHRFTVPSALPVASARPSGENATA